MYNKIIIEFGFRMISCSTSSNNCLITDHVILVKECPKTMSLGELQKHQKPLCATQCKIISWTGLSKTTGALNVDPLIWLIEETNQQTCPESGFVPSQNTALNYVTVSVPNVFSLWISGHFSCSTTTVSPKVTTTAGSYVNKTQHRDGNVSLLPWRVYL